MSQVAPGEATRPFDPALTEAPLDADLRLAAQLEAPPGQLCLDIARGYLRQGEQTTAGQWLLRVADDVDEFRPWLAGAALLPSVVGSLPAPARSARIAVLGTYTTSQLVPMIGLAVRRFGVEVELFEGDYAQHEQQLLDPGSTFYAFAPDYVVIAAHEGATRLSRLEGDPESAVAAEALRWTSLWRLARERAGCRIVQHLFAVRPEAPFGHLGTRLPGARDTMIHALNARLSEEAGDDVLLVDCERLAAQVGKRHWFDDRYWHIAKQAVALGALPLLARQTAAVVAAGIGLSKKCIVLDLDNTLWGGVIGEDGVDGIAIGEGPEGEAFLAFQRFLLDLKATGILLAVCSKNNPADARLPFDQHPDMAVRLDDIVAFEAGWDHKPDVIRRIAADLGLGLDSLIFVDDSPFEREAVRRELPDVDVIVLPSDPSGYVRALSEYPLLESVRLTDDDRHRTAQYQARKRAKTEEAAISDLPTFWRSLDMRATIAPIDDLRISRVAQLIAKTNQYNLTTKRHSLDTLQQMRRSSQWVHFYAALRDRFADHGVVAVVLAKEDDSVLEIDTLLMSCRVIGRTLEQALLSRLCIEALDRGCTQLRGRYVPTAKIALANELFITNGFILVSENDDGSTDWHYDVAEQGLIQNDYVTIEAL